MMLIMGITLYTSRVVLGVLGIDNFGIYDVVGGMVVLFSFLSGTVTGATQRFLCVALGRRDREEIRSVFASSLTAYLIMSVAIVVLGETIGLWAVSHWLSFPPGREGAAITVYQITILTTVFSMMRMPYQAAIIAYEKMGFFAWSSVLEAALRLAILYPLYHIDTDKLVVYAWLMCGVSLVLGVMYVVYVQRSFPDCRTRPDRTRLGEILAFTGWSSFSSLANIGSRQMMSFMLNFFYGVAINAAVGIMNQVSNAVYGFIQNFQTAINPPLTKHYAAGERQEVVSMLYSVSRLSYYLLLVLSMPLMFYIEAVLSLWLAQVPRYTGALCVLSLLALYFNTFGGPVWTIMQATGRIRRYQLYISSVTLLTIPLFWLMLYVGLPPYLVVIPTLMANVTVVFIGLQMIKRDVGFRLRTYMRRVVWPCLATSALLAAIIMLWGLLGLTESLHGWPYLIVNLSVGYSISLAVVWWVGLGSDERAHILEMIKNRLHIK